MATDSTDLRGLKVVLADEDEGALRVTAPLWSATWARGRADGGGAAAVANVIAPPWSTSPHP
jgi:hypothetical protein